MSRASRASALCCAAFALAIGCREQALTQIVVVVDSDWDGFSRLEIDIDGFEHDMPVKVEPRRGRPLLPRRVALVHDGGELGPIAVTVRGFAAGHEQPVLTEPRTRLFFERGKTRMLKIDLLFDCIDACDPGQACLAGPECVSSHDDRAIALTPWEGDVDGLDVVYKVGRGDVIDAGADGGVVPPTGGEGGVSAEGGPAVPDAAEDAAPPGGDADAQSDADTPPVLFEYTPSNFDPASQTIDGLGRREVTLDCGRSGFDSGTLVFSNWCGAEPESATIEQSDGSEVVVLVMDSLTIASDSTLELSGPLPVVLAVYGDARIDGTIDAAAHGSAPGPGADLACEVGAGQPGVAGDSNTGGGGGGGGGFHSRGGDGGQGGDSAGSSAADAVIGGAVHGSPALVPLRGGCPGGAGGTSGGPVAGGGGGGALQISAAGLLEVHGTINASGGGGAAGIAARDGGGGGGSGGAILLEAASFEFGVDAVLSANGGGGGAGQPSTAGVSGDGEDGSAGATAASGGTPPSNAGSGGDGAALDLSAQSGGGGGTGSFYGYGGGGGGGGLGRVRIRGVDSCSPPGTFSPAPSVECAQCGSCTSPPSSGCEEIAHAGKTYYRCDDALEWEEAVAACEAVNLQLVRVDDAAENDMIATDIVEDHWLGASDIAAEGDWRWTDGTRFWSGEVDGAAVSGRYNAWASDQPDNAVALLSNADCAVITADAEWTDRSCTVVHPYVCEP